MLLTAEFCCVAWDYACNKKNVVLTEGTSWFIIISFQISIGFSLFEAEKERDVFCAGAMARRVCLSLTEELSELNCSTF